MIDCDSMAKLSIGTIETPKPPNNTNNINNNSQGHGELNPIITNSSSITNTTTTSLSPKSNNKNKFVDFWRRTACNPILEHKSRPLLSLDSWGSCSSSRRVGNGILRESKLKLINATNTTSFSVDSKKQTKDKQIKLSDLAKQVTLLRNKQGTTTTSGIEDLNFNRLSLKNNDLANTLLEASSENPSPTSASTTINLSSVVIHRKNRRLQKPRSIKWKSRLNLKRSSLNSSSSSLPSIPEEEEEENELICSLANVCSTTCSQQALMETNNSSDDVTIDELASYLDVLVHIPKKMSTMAEMMYT